MKLFEKFVLVPYKRYEDLRKEKSHIDPLLNEQGDKVKEDRIEESSKKRDLGKGISTTEEVEYNQEINNKSSKDNQGIVKENNQTDIKLRRESTPTKETIQQFGKVPPKPPGIPNKTPKIKWESIF